MCPVLREGRNEAIMMILVKTIPPISYNNTIYYHSYNRLFLLSAKKPKEREKNNYVLRNRAFTYTHC